LAVLVTVGGNSRGQIRGVGGANLYRMVSFFPYVVPAVVVGILFAFIYSPNGGLLNGMLGLVGLNPGIGWLGHRDLALWAIMAAVVWSLVGFYMVLFVAAIKAVPSEIVEAARLDGCGRFRLAVGVILPLIWPFCSAFKNSREILTSPFGLPETLGLDNFITAWQEAGIGRFFGNTVIVVGGALFLVMLLGSMCAYVLARYEFPGRRL